MSHWTHFVTEADLDTRKAPEQWEVEEAWEAERVALCNADNEAEKAEWKAFLDSLPAWQRQWDEAPLRRLKERRDKAFECEARRAEHEGLSVCGDDEWARR